MNQVYTDRRALSLKASAIVEYRAQNVSLNFPKTCCRFLVNHGNKFAGLLLECTTNDDQDECEKSIENRVDKKLCIVPLYESMRDCKEKDARNMKLQVLHEGMETIVQLLSNCVRLRCLMNVREKQSKGHPSSISYCCYYKGLGKVRKGAWRNVVAVHALFDYKT